MKKIILLSFALLALVSACQKERLEKGLKFPVKLPEATFQYSKYDLPNHFINVQLALDTLPIQKRLTDEKATLGRVLFYDPKLSLNNATACASCHFQENAFATPSRFSEGFAGSMTKRNSLAIANTGYLNQLFWDARSRDLYKQVLMPVGDHIEMGMEPEKKLPEKLQRVDYYPPLFQAAFGDETVTTERISIALAQFLSAMVSASSKYDEGVAQNFANFTPMEKEGKELFQSKALCASCHGGQLFQSTWSTFNIGLDVNYADNGAGYGRFKTPSLRNVALTAPYMHDGRFETLEEVVNHYNEGIQPHPSLDWRLRGPLRLNLSSAEKQALVAFLHTLTDENFIRDERFSDPF